MIFPQIKKINANKYSFKDEIKVSIFSDEKLYIEKYFSWNDIQTFDDGNLKIKTSFFEDKNKEKYKLFSKKTNNEKIEIQIKYCSDISLYRAVNTVARMILSNEIVLGNVTDYPSFSQRGFIEGFYGKPWDEQDRLSILKLMSQNHMNTYYYGPKDDPYHREKWDILYPENEIKKLKKLFDFTKEIFLNFYFCIAPGLTVCYSDELQYNKLLQKIHQLYEIGIKNFGLFLDDIPERFQHETDKAKFSSLVDAHVFYINKVYSDLKKIDDTINLTVCPYQYNGYGNEEYISTLGKGLPQDVSIFFTGYNICSQELTVREAKIFSKNTLHKPLYWDNFPVNDAEMFMEMHIGPITGRDANLHKYSEGIISNVMEYANSSKISLLTIADYLWNSENYDSTMSWNNALKIIFGKDSEKIKYFAENLITSCLKNQNSEMMAECLSKATFYRNMGDEKKMLEILKDYYFKMTECRDYLNSAKGKIFDELSRWIKKYNLCCEIFEATIIFYENKTKQNHLTMKEMMTAYNESATILTEFCFREFVEYTIDNVEVEA